MGGCCSLEADTEDTHRLFRSLSASPAMVDPVIENEKVVSTATSIANDSMTWEFCVPDIRNLGHTPLYSSPLLMNNLRWRIKIWVHKSWSSVLLPKWTLALFLVCDTVDTTTSEDSGWRCDVAADFRLLPWSDKCPQVTKSFVHTYLPPNPECGVEEFIAFEDIMDLENGFVNPENFSLHLMAVVTAKMSRKRSSASLSSAHPSSTDSTGTTPSDQLKPYTFVQIEQLINENMVLKQEIKQLKEAMEDMQTKARATEKRLDYDINKAEARAKIAEERSERFICKLCFEQDSSLLFYPCKHIACCDDCNALLKCASDMKCPVCRVPVKSAVSVFHS